MAGAGSADPQRVCFLGSEPAVAYTYRRIAYPNKGEYDKAIEDYIKAILIELVVPVLTDLVGILRQVQCRFPSEPPTGLAERWIVAQLIE
jgi:hypothetical protein